MLGTLRQVLVVSVVSILAYILFVFGADIVNLYSSYQHKPGGVIEALPVEPSLNRSGPGIEVIGDSWADKIPPD